jgi:hypothetical protein
MALELQVGDVADGLEPVIDEAEALATHRRPNSAAAIVAADDDMLYGELVDGELDDRKHVEVGRVDQVRNVTMNEYLAGFEACDHIRRHSAIGAANPEILGTLKL